MTNTTTRRHGPELLDERSVTGVAVHLLALFTGVLGAGLVYALSRHEYTRANARNAFNWHLSVTLLTALAVATFLLGADELTVAGETVEWSLLPEPFATGAGVAGTILLFVAMAAWLLTVLFPFVATGKAIFGTVWKYPFAREFLG